MKRPIVITLLVLSLLCVLAGIAAVAFFTVRSEGFTFDIPLVSATAEESKTLKVDAKKPVALNVNDYAGDVTIVSGDSDKVIVKAVKTGSASNQKKAEEDLKNIKYEVKQSGNTITVTYDPGKVSTRDLDTVDFIITVPENTSAEVQGNMGDVKVSDIKGNVNLNSDFGKTEVDGVTGALLVESQSGTIKVSKVDAGEADITLKTDFGEVNLEKASGQNVSINSQSGAIKLLDVAVTADLVVSTDFGEINIEKVTAKSYDLATQSGAITVDGAKGKLKAYTDFGNINISNAVSVTLDVHTQSGSIDFAGSLGEGPHSLKSDFGGITLTLPADSAFNVDLATDFGSISSDIPITVTGNIKEQHQVGTINGGGSLLKVETQSGTITVKTSK